MTDFSKSKDYIYEGLVNLENQKNGFGKLISPSLISYEGEWCKDKPIGDFTILYPPDILNESVKYIGTINDKLERHGKNGVLYKGPFYTIQVRSLCIRDRKDLGINSDIYSEILKLPKGEWINDIIIVVV